MSSNLTVSANWSSGYVRYGPFEGESAQALQFAILAAARSGEVDTAECAFGAAPLRSRNEDGHGSLPSPPGRRPSRLANMDAL